MTPQDGDEEDGRPKIECETEWTLTKLATDFSPLVVLPFTKPPTADLLVPYSAFAVVLHILLNPAMSDRASSSDEAGPSLQPTSGGKAPQRHLPRTTFTAVEYLGPVSRPSALLKVITQDDLNQCFNSPAGTTGVQLEMRYRMGDRAGVPVRGTRVPTSKLLLKIKRRRRKGAESDAEGGAEGSGKGKGREQGVFVAEIVGSVAQTVRFRRELLL